MRCCDLAEAVHDKLDLSRYGWFIEQLSLLENPKDVLHIWRTAAVVVETEGRSSERAGIAFGMCPSWAWEKAERIVEAAEVERLKFLRETDSLLEQGESGL